MDLPRVTVVPGREKSLRQRHPWVFSGSIAKVDGDPGAGETVAIHAADGAFLATAAWSPTSKIRARVWSFDAHDQIDAAFIAARVAAAVRAREAMLDSTHSGCRLIHGESDGLPGLVADRYGKVLVVQLLSAGAEVWRDVLAAALSDATGCATIFERSDADVRALEGLLPRVGLTSGALPEPVTLL
jgi:23S rRNA (cytosine1962-C5)-methyltransferase